MNTIEFVSDDGKRRSKAQIASSWDEMTAEQVRHVFRRYDAYARGEISALQLNIEVLYKLLGLRLQRPHGKLPEDSPLGEHIYELCEQCLTWLFVKPKEEGQLMTLAFDSVQNPLPTVSGGPALPLLIGPATLCQDLTFGEFRHASAALNSFFRSGEIDDLNECIAHLYRPRSSKRNKAGRAVRPVDPATFESDLRRVRSMEPWQRTLVMMWFSRCIGFLQTGTLQLNGETVDLSLLFGSEGQDSAIAFTWNDLLVQMARENTIGNIEAVDEQPLMVVIALMWSNYKQSKANEQKLKKSQKA